MSVEKLGGGQPAVIVLEFNELVPRLMEKFISEGRLPNFKALRDQSLVSVTDTLDHGSRELEPWVQYVVTHTGVRVASHGIWNLAQGNLYNGPRYWDVASQAGLKVLLWCSMNIGTQPGFKGIVMPDPWAGETVKAQPPDLEAFSTYVQKNVQEHTSNKTPVSKGEMLRFAWFLLSHGVRLQTWKNLCRQLASERSGHGKWRRAFVLDQIVADTFCNFYRRQQPNLATLFLNSTAFVQHRYWRNMEPEHFEIQPTAEDQKLYSTAIREGYENMDRIVGQVRTMAPNATIVLCTAHSQQPHLGHEKTGGKICFRPHDFGKMVSALQLKGMVRIEPVMTEQFRVRFETAAQAEAAKLVFHSAQLDGEKVFNIAVEEPTALFGGCRIHHPVEAGQTFEFMNQGQQTLEFHKVFYRIAAVKSGRHHPDGIFWIARPNQVRQDIEGRIPITSVAPTVLQLLGLPAPDCMSEPGLLENMNLGRSVVTVA